MPEPVPDALSQLRAQAAAMGLQVSEDRLAGLAQLVAESRSQAESVRSYVSLSEETGGLDLRTYLVPR